MRAPPTKRVSSELVPATQIVRPRLSAIVTITAILRRRHGCPRRVQDRGVQRAVCAVRDVVLRIVSITAKNKGEVGGAYFVDVVGVEHGALLSVLGLCVRGVLQQGVVAADLGVEGAREELGAH